MHCFPMNTLIFRATIIDIFLNIHLRMKERKTRRTLITPRIEK